MPERFRSMTWIEEQVCARFRSTAYVTRLHYMNDPKHPYVLHGNTCAFEQDVVSTADTLPRVPSDLEECLSIIFTGPKREIPQSALKKIFRIRKPLVLDFLHWLQENNRLYANVKIDAARLDQYDEDGMIPNLNDRIIVADAPSIFANESAGIEQHPALELYADGSGDEPDDPRIFLESCGIFDANNTDIPA